MRPNDEISTFLEAVALELAVVELRTFFLYELSYTTPQRSELNAVVCNDLGKGLAQLDATGMVGESST